MKSPVGIDSGRCGEDDHLKEAWGKLEELEEVGSQLGKIERQKHNMFIMSYIYHSDTNPPNLIPLHIQSVGQCLEHWSPWCSPACSWWWECCAPGSDPGPAPMFCLGREKDEGESFMWPPGRVSKASEEVQWGRTVPVWKNILWTLNHTNKTCLSSCHC